MSKRKQRAKSQNPLRMIVYGFGILISLGTLLLMLPTATASGQSAGFLTALFTTTSASCVTGLVVQDTLTFWSGSGQLTILILIQIGGLGVMLSVATVMLALGRRITVKERLLISQSISMSEVSGIVRLAKQIIFGVVIFEGIGALLLTAAFVGGGTPFWQALWKGIFHSISAFCNAGFDLMGDFASFTGMRSNVAITLTLSALIILGGLGFYVWNDLWKNATLSKSERHTLSIHTKVVLWTTALLIIGGTIGFMALEWNNPQTIGNDGTATKIMSSFFQSVTTRTAGFNQLDQASLTSGGNLLTQALMFIGGSPGSTAGGIKTTTFMILCTSVWAILRGKAGAVIGGRTIPPKTVSDASTIFFIGIVLVVMSTILISGFDGHITLRQALFESVSAFGTVGLSEGITPTLSAPSQVVLIVLMFLGRVGVMTFGLAALTGTPAERKMKPAEGKILI